jgi:hypothetical protein
MRLKRADQSSSCVAMCQRPRFAGIMIGLFHQGYFSTRDSTPVTLYSREFLESTYSTPMASCRIEAKIENLTTQLFTSTNEGHFGDKSPVSNL